MRGRAPSIKHRLPMKNIELLHQRLSAQINNKYIFTFHCGRQINGAQTESLNTC